MVDGAAGVEARVKDDFYPTPAECVTALLPHIKDFPYFVWEPACGDGAIADVLDAVFQVSSTDLVGRGYGMGGIDFLECNSRQEGYTLYDAIITNPPYHKDLPEKFIRHAFKLGVTHMALLLKADFWSSQRGGLFEEFPPSRIHPLTWRPDFTGKGKPFLNVSWSVWRPGDTSARVVRLHRP